MIVINLTIVIGADVVQERSIIAPSYAKMFAEERMAREELRYTSHTATCDRCGWCRSGYETAGRARMGLSGHKKSCRRQS